MVKNEKSFSFSFPLLSFVSPQQKSGELQPSRAATNNQSVIMSPINIVLMNILVIV
jgi:hypothetical protein